MNSLYLDSQLSDEERRQALYKGQLFGFSPTPASTALIEHARSMIEDAFGDLDPTMAQHEMSVEDFAATLTELKPAFIHHPTSKKHLSAMLEELGCDLERTY